jgi:hypothetical protein
MKLLLILGLVLGTVVGASQIARSNGPTESSVILQQPKRLELSTVTDRQTYKRSGVTPALSKSIDMGLPLGAEFMRKLQ